MRYNTCDLLVWRKIRGVTDSTIWPARIGSFVPSSGESPRCLARAAPNAAAASIFRLPDASNPAPLTENSVKDESRSAMDLPNRNKTKIITVGQTTTPSNFERMSTILARSSMLTFSSSIASTSPARWLLGGPCGEAAAPRGDRPGFRWRFRPRHPPDRATTPPRRAGRSRCGQ